MEGGANAFPGEAAERGANANAGAALASGNANGTAVDGFSRVEELAAKPAGTAEGGANACPSKAVERGVNASPGAVLADVNANGAAADMFPRVDKHAAKPAAAAEGGARAGASTVRRTRMPDVGPFRRLNEKSTCESFRVCATAGCRVYDSF